MGLDSSEVKRFCCFCCCFFVFFLFFVFFFWGGGVRSVAVKRDFMLVTSSCNLDSNMGERACPETEHAFYGASLTHHPLYP